MKRVEVKSSNIKSIGYDPKLKMLEVEFKTGGLYQYKHVPPRIYTDFLKAPSKGAYVEKNIKKIFPFQKIEIKK
jgi:hypothetical protein